MLGDFYLSFNPPAGFGLTAVLFGKVLADGASEPPEFHFKVGLELFQK